MDILISSNLERLLYHLSAENTDHSTAGAEITSLMESLEKNKSYTVSDKIKSGLADFAAGFADESETEKTIAAMYNDNGYLIDTHTAVAYKVYEDYRKSTGDTTPTVIASTASAYKFAASVNEALGIPAGQDGFESVRTLNEKTGVRIPAGLKDLDKKEIRHTGVIEKTELADAVLKSLK
jgi:threonine synthase